ncbi:Phosphotyrosine-binding domain family protein [Brugia pahangi]
MSESQTSSASPSTTLTISNNLPPSLPLDDDDVGDNNGDNYDNNNGNDVDVISLPKVEAKLLEISNSLQNCKSIYANDDNDVGDNNGDNYDNNNGNDVDVISLPKVEAKLLEISNSLQNCKSIYANDENFCSTNDDNDGSECILKNTNSMIVKFDVQMDEQTLDNCDAAKLSQNATNDNEIKQQTNNKTNDKIENDEKQKGMINDETIESDMIIAKSKGQIIDNEVVNVWITSTDTQNIEINDEEEIGKNSKFHKREGEKKEEEEGKGEEKEEKKMIMNLATNINELSIDKSTSLMIKNCDEDDASLMINLKSNTNRFMSKSPDHASVRTVSESPPGANDSWKNATINMQHSFDNDNQNDGKQSTYNTTFRNHQTKITYNNKTLNLGEVIHHHPLFVKNTSKYWYKPTISREDAVNMLRDKPPGTFVVRDSNSFPGAFGLALKVATPPPGVHPGDGTELVRHFLIEPSPKGVKLKGCNNEPVFGTLSALVYQHSIIPLALPTKLLLPEYDPANTPEHISAAQQLLQQGAACNVTYIISLDTESLTGPEAARRCIDQTFDLLKQKMIQPVSVHFKVSSQGITITDNTRRLFFRRHYPVQSVTYAGLDPSDRRWDNSYLEGSVTKYVKNARMFAFVARKIGSRTDNTCHIFAELEPEQPATAVVNFITKVMMGRR